MTLKSLAKKLGVSQPALSQAAKAGRLGTGVEVRKGKFVLVDEKAAAAAFLRSRTKPGPTSEPTRPKDLVEAQLAVLAERERTLRLKNDELEGSLVAAADVTGRWEEMTLSAKERLLALPVKARQEALVDDPGEERLLELVHEALSELAARGMGAERTA